MKPFSLAVHSAILCAVLAPLAWAEAPTNLDPIVVTATRTPEPESQTLASVSVIDRAQIERRQAVSVPDLLRGLPGVNVVGSGGPGQPASVFVRGTDADHVLVLIDGVKVGSATLGIVPFQDLPIAQIDRVELVRGPRSSLYGSEAVGGVIQIFTRKGGGALTPRVSFAAGTYDSASLSLGVSGGGEQGWFNLGASLEQTDGFNACDGQPFPFAGCGVYEWDRDGYSNRSANARAGYRFSDQAQVDFHLLRSDNQTDFDGGPYSGNTSISAQQVLGASARLQPLTPWTLILSAGRSWDKYRAYFEGEFLDRFDTQRDSLSLQNDLVLVPGQLLTLGLDYQNDRVDGSVAYTEDSRDNLGIFGEYQGGWGPVNAKLSLRRDDNQQFGYHDTGNMALGYLFSTGIQVTLSYGTAFKAPTFNDLYYPVFGNSDLDPEQSRSVEFDISGTLPGGNWGLNLFQSEIDELIAFDAMTFQVDNIDQARIRGLEAFTNLELWSWQWGLTLTLLDPVNQSQGPNAGNLLPRRPQQNAELDLHRGFGPWSVGGTLYYAGRRYDDLANSVSLAPYTLLDLRLEYAFSPAVRVQGRLSNVLDEDYETAAYYNQPGRAFMLTFRYEP